MLWIIYWAFIDLSEAEVYGTLNDTDLSFARFCMDNKHPYKPSTFSCEDFHISHTSSILSTTSQILKKLDPGYSPSSSLYPTFPALSTGILTLQSSYPLSSLYYAKNAVFGTLIGTEVGCWKPYGLNTNQYLYIGSSVPFVFQKIVTAESGSLINIFILLKLFLS